MFVTDKNVMTFVQDNKPEFVFAEFKESAMSKLGEDAPDLKHVTFIQCRLSGLLGQLGKGCRRIIKVTAVQCDITDADVGVLCAVWAETLTAVDFDCCPNLTDEVISQLAAAPNLTKIGLATLTGMTYHSQAIEGLGKAHPNLTELSFGAEQITKTVLETILANNRALLKVTLGCECDVSDDDANDLMARWPDVQIRFE